MTRLRLLTIAAATAVALVAARPVVAGPPLVCFPFDIGTARSLPMGTGGWHARGPLPRAAEGHRRLARDRPELRRVAPGRRHARAAHERDTGAGANGDDPP